MEAAPQKSTSHRLQKSPEEELHKKAFEHLCEQARRGRFLPRAMMIETYVSIAANLRRQLLEQLSKAPEGTAARPAF
jgi:hypothetical protein